jgi:hypothetical protein
MSFDIKTDSNEKYTLFASFILLVVPTPDNGYYLAIGGIEDWQGKPKFSEKTCPDAILFSTNPT